MEIRINNLIETLRRLPHPEYIGERRRVLLLKASWEELPFNPIKASDINSTDQDFIIIRAKQYSNGDDNIWLDWVIDI
jgi:hypothetical protein